MQPLQTLVTFEQCYRKTIHFQKSAPIRPRTSPQKYARRKLCLQRLPLLFNDFESLFKAQATLVVATLIVATLVVATLIIASLVVVTLVVSALLKALLV